MIEDEIAAHVEFIPDAAQVDELVSSAAKGIFTAVVSQGVVGAVENSNGLVEGSVSRAATVEDGSRAVLNNIDHTIGTLRRSEK